MRAKLYWFNAGGEILRKERCSYSFASSNNPPVIVIDLSKTKLNKTKSLYLNLDIPSKALMQFIKRRLSKTEFKEKTK